MDKHPIESIMRTTMENIRDMIDVNTVVGDAVETSDGSMIIPISRVSFGFLAGGGEYRCEPEPKTAATATEKDLPFAGGTGAGVTVQPMGFLVVGQGGVKMLPAQYNTPIDRIVELVPQLISDVQRMTQEGKKEKAEMGDLNAGTMHGKTAAAGAQPSAANAENYPEADADPMGS